MSAKDASPDAQNGAVPRPRVRKAKGKRPPFFADPDTDRLFSLTMALMVEVSALRERLDTHERLGDQEKPVTIASVEAFAPDDMTAEARAAWRKAFIKRAFRVYLDEAEGAPVDQGIKEFSEDDFVVRK
jgi:hypothetical protein